MPDSGRAPDASADAGAPAIPLARDSPWPKFRANAEQTGRSPVHPPASGGLFWSFRTGKGIFSTPVIGGDGTIYVGSADRTFYALAPDGTVRWQVLTDEIIDSSALLDDRGRVYFGSGDGHLRALDAASGDEVWSFEADDPAVIHSFIRWFEGNVAIGPSGDLYVPNDNFLVYAIDRDDGAVRWAYQMADQTWSLPAVDPRTGTLYIGNNNLLPLLGDNTFAIDSQGQRVWSASVTGTVAASPMLTPDGRVIVGGFDGFVRAYDAASGELLWSFGTRDHVYASPALGLDGSIIQPSADGTVYALDPASGAVRWAFDTGEAIRSSAAIDADGHVYFGSGDGRLVVLDPDGALRWSIQLIADARNDLNSSPALGRDAIYIGGESGEVFSVPYDFCLRDETASDARCTRGPGEGLPDDGAFLYYTTEFGGTLTTPPATIDANQPLAFSLFVREHGDTKLALLDSDTLDVRVDPPAAADVDVSGDRRFVTVTPVTAFEGGAERRAQIRIRGRYLVNPMREGLRMRGGAPGGTFDQTFAFALSADRAGALPMPIPAAPGDPAGVWEMSRLAAPLPAILPSYNQIGFDSLHYLITLVEGDEEHAIAWVTGARLAHGENRTEVDPGTRALFPLDVAYHGGAITFLNSAGFTIEVTSATIPFDVFRISSRLDETGASPVAHVHVTTVCGSIPFYGAFLQTLGFCNPQTDILNAFGAAILRPHEGGRRTAPAGLGTVRFARTERSVVATLTGSSLQAGEHSAAILLVDAETGRPVTIDYGFQTTTSPGASGELSSVTLDTSGVTLPASVRAYLMLDAYPAARTDLP